MTSFLLEGVWALGKIWQYWAAGIVVWMVVGDNLNCEVPEFLEHAVGVSV